MFHRASQQQNIQSLKWITDTRTLSVTGEVAVPDERDSSAAVMDWICASRLLSIWGTWPVDAWVPVAGPDPDDVFGICWANCCCSSCSCSRLNVGSNVCTQQIQTSRWLPTITSPTRDNDQRTCGKEHGEIDGILKTI